MTCIALSDQNCSNCRYYRRVKSEDLCCRRPPELAGAGMMPLCPTARWCGEWSANEVES